LRVASGIRCLFVKLSPKASGGALHTVLIHKVSP
jgi:hypothetical protein